MRATEATKVGLGLVLAVACCAAASAAEPQVLAVSPDGFEVTDDKYGVAWARCAEGMQWSGKTCTGVALRLDHTQALAAAAARRKADGLSWRLPRVPELKRLAAQSEQLRHHEPRPFPAAPADWYWSSSTTLDTSRVNPYAYGNISKGLTEQSATRISFLHGWAVHSTNGQTDGAVLKRSTLPVRLVRSLDP
jgi:hypothetical protein